MVTPAAQALGVPDGEVLPGLGGSPLTALIEGRTTEDEYWDAVLARTGWTTAPATLADLARDAFRQVVPGMPGLLRELDGCRLVLLSDHAREWMQDIEARHASLLAIFRRRFISWEMRRTKRDPETFLYVAAELCAAPRDCVFVDDSPRNVERAKQVGLQAILFEDVEQLRRDLRRAGLPCSSPR
jgi:HAD superfamily hydrolase (TIGR01509 family)